MAPVSGDDLKRVLDRIDSTLPGDRPRWPGGYPNQVELALIDAVLSIRTRYGSATNGVRKRVEDYAATRRPAVADDLRVLAQHDPAELGTLLNTRQVTRGTPKPVAIVQAAQNLAAVGVIRSADLEPASIDQQRAYCSVHGLGRVTWEYFLMLSHHPGVKADTWIVRFVAQALDRRIDSSEASELVKAAATELGLTATAGDVPACGVGRAA